MVAIPNFLVLQPLVPFMRHHSEKKIVEKHPLHNFKLTFSPFSCPMLPSYMVQYICFDQFKFPQNLEPVQLKTGFGY